MQTLYELAHDIYEPLVRFWESERTESTVCWLLVALFLGSLVGIELKRQGLLPQPMADFTPDHYFHAVSVAFTLVLIMEIIGLVFVLPCSFSKSVGKQFEILALILLRNSFKELVHLPVPLHLTGDWSPILHIASDGGGALAIFAMLGWYYQIKGGKAQQPMTKSPYARYAFVALKKMLAMVLLVIFVALGAKALWLELAGDPGFDFFDTFYTVLVFADILLVLISQRFMPGFRAVFRNSGYALSTLFIRLALAAPPYFGALLGVGAAVFAVALTLVFNRFYAQQAATAEQW
jgi:hypothetical protein